MKLILEKIHPRLDGAYDYDESYFTNFELHAIKRATGITAGDIGEAFGRLDNDVVVAIAMVTLMRAGKIEGKTPWATEQMDALWNAQTGRIVFDSEEGDEARPPDLTPGSDDDLSVRNGSSGADSTSSSESPDSDPSLTGHPV